MSQLRLGEKLTREEFNKGLLEIGASIGVDYVDALEPPSADYVTPDSIKLGKLRDVVLKNDHEWTLERWKAIVEIALGPFGIKYPTWSLPEFFQLERGPRVYEHAWAREMMLEGRHEEIRAYKSPLPGRSIPIWGLRCECDGRLEAWEQPAPQKPQLPEPGAPMSESIKEQLQRTKAELQKKLESDPAESAHRRAERNAEINRWEEPIDNPWLNERTVPQTESPDALQRGEA